MPDSQSDNRPSNVGDIRPGDLIFFRGRDWKSQLIMAGTGPFWDRGFSHVGFASHISSHHEIMLIGSTTLDDDPCFVTGNTSGVRARMLEDVLDWYDGEVWVYPLPRVLFGHRVDYNFVARTYTDSQLGKPYDMAGALHCRGSFLCGLLWKLFGWEETRDALFCSELAGGWLVETGLLKCDNVSKLNPTTLAMLGTEQGAFSEPWRVRV